VATLYSATVTVEGGRQGHARSDDGKLDIDLSVPAALGGGGGDGTNPEQLFAAGYSACFQTALRHTAKDRGLAVDSSSITATVSLVPDENGFKLQVELDVSLPDIAREDAEKLVEIVHSSVCPYSKAVRGNIDVTIRVV
jgi:lipoyl-dependent peroxiredoxin